MANGMPGFHDPREEVLERVWTLREHDGASLADVLSANDHTGVSATIEQLVREGLLHRDGERLSLSPDGERTAKHVVRAHRLAARLLTDLLELPATTVEAHACQLEHAITPELADNLCTLLGHPPMAPDGSPIPRGECCDTQRRGITPAIRQLAALSAGEVGRIVFIHPRYIERLDQLSALGLVPGTDVRVKQRHPSLVVEVGETTLALDTEIARDVHVKPV